MSASQSVQEKAKELVSDGLVEIIRNDEVVTRARVYGEHDVYEVLIGPGYRRCSCPALKQCSHIEAVLLAIGR